MYKIAFFGSDLFSLASFKEILNLRKSRPDIVHSLSLVTRQLKVSGRGLKKAHKPAIVDYAESENIDWHEVETSSDFQKISGMSNLAIAVSYGRLIPDSYLKSLQYGGLNVHPSRLPQYRGASPLQQCIMDRQPITGVSVQTLHPTKFDHGEVLWRSQPIEVAPRETTGSLMQKLGDVGAQGLKEVLVNVDLSPTSQDVGRGPLNEQPGEQEHIEPSRAPILDKSLYKIDFSKGYLDLDARGRALDKLYFTQKVEQKQPKRGKPKGHPIIRVNLSKFEPVDSVHCDTPSESALGSVFPGSSPDGAKLLCLKVKDGFLGAAEITVQGYKPESAEQYFSNLEKRRLKNVVVGDADT